MDQIKISSAWYEGAKTAKEKENIKQFVLADKKVLDKLSEICYNMYIRETKITSKDYENTDWAFKQAHRNGELDNLRKILSIIDLNKDYQL